jgi:hypothetical protein
VSPSSGYRRCLKRHFKQKLRTIDNVKAIDNCIFKDKGKIVPVLN